MSDRPRFDLAREPWVPVVWADPPADAPERLGLRGLLVLAHRVREVMAPSPLQTAAVYRLLQALFLGVEPESGDRGRWRALWDAGRFDADRVDAYFDARPDAFDLLHPDRPFYGHPEPLAREPSPVARLFEAEASGNNPTLFSHLTEADERRVTLADAALGLVATQAATLGGGKSEPYYFSDAPLAAGVVFWMRGPAPLAPGESDHDTLFHALLLNTPPSASARMGRWGDAPAWDRPLPSSDLRLEDGYADYLTWQSRRARLVLAPGDEAPAVAAVTFSQGDARKDPAGGQVSDDPLMAKRPKSDGALIPLKFRSERALWRDAYAFVGAAGSGAAQRPATFDWAADPYDSPVADRPALVVDAYGLANDQSKYELVRHERTRVYPHVLRSRAHQETLREALDRAERQAGTLRKAMTACARVLSDENGEGKKAADRARAVARSLQAEPRFWSALDVRFERWAQALAEVPDPEADATPDPQGAADGLERHLALWTRTLHRVARQAYRDATADLTATERQLRAAAVGEDKLRPAAAYADALTSPDDA